MSKNNLTKFVTGAFASFANHALALAVALILTPLIVGILGKDSYGLWVVLMTLFTYYELLDGGVSFAVARFFAKSIGKQDDKELSQWVATGYVLFFATTLLTLILGGVFWLAAGVFFSEGGNEDLVRVVIAIYIPAMAVGFLARLHKSLLKAQLMYDRLALASSLRVVLSAVASYFLVIHGYGVLGLAIAQACGLVLESLAIYVYSRRVWPGLGFRSSAFSLHRAKELLGYSVYSLLMRFASQLRNAVDPLIIAAMLGTSAVTYYSIGMRFVTMLVDLIGVVAGGPLLSWMSQVEGRSNAAELRGLYMTSLRLCAAAGVFGAGGLIIFGRDFLVWWMGFDFEISYDLMVIGSLSAALITASYPAANWMYAKAKHAKLIKWYIGAGVFNCFVSILLVTKVGLLGAVIGTLLETLLYALLIVPWVTQKDTEVAVSQYFLCQLRGILWPAVGILLFFSASQTLLQPDLWRLVAGGACYVMTLVPCVWLGVLTPEERGHLLAALRGKIPGH